MEYIPEQTREVPLQTVRGLWVVLSELIEKGHGETAIGRADSEANVEPFGVGHLELYDMQKEMKEGIVEYPFVFLLC